jgi:predicted MFS family arabinose efflux permease
VSTGRRHGADNIPTLPKQIVASVSLGTLLNPLNSSMIAVALVSLSDSFGVSLATATWLVTAFYAGGAIGYPLMGQLADRLGPRRVFNSGLLVAAVTSGLAPLAPSLPALIGIRFLQSIGTSSPYPAGIALFRARHGSGRAPAGALGAVSIANSVSAALGPVLGGALVALAGWPAIFVVNVPIALLAVATSMVWLPADRPRSNAPSESKPTVRVWQLLRSPSLAWVYAQFAAVNVVFYAMFYGLPLWLEQTRGYPPELTGVLILPIAGIGVLATPIAARLINRTGPRPAVIIGSALLLLGSLLLLSFDSTTSLVGVVAVGAVLGVPNGFNNLGLQAAMYEVASPEQIGAAAGVLQTCRYVGAIASTAVIGLIFGSQASSQSLHALALVMAAFSVALVVASVRAHRPS